MEVQHAQVPIKELYDIAQRNYKWESFKYQIPTVLSPTTQTKPSIKRTYPRRKNYLDDLQRNKATIPGPSHYPTLLTHSRPLSGKIGKQKRLTLAEEAITKSKKENIPGPAAYFSRPNTPTIPQKRPNSAPGIRQHYLHEVLYVAASSPGVGAYNIAHANPIHVTAPVYPLKRPQSVATKLKRKPNKIRKGYFNMSFASISGTFDYLAQHPSKKNTTIFSKAKRFDNMKEIAKQPSPASYKLNHSWTSRNNLLSIVASSNPTPNVYYR